MHNLGIPTTRAGTLITSDTKVVRDIFYNGNPKLERASIVLRISQSFIRFPDLSQIISLIPLVLTNEL